MIKCYCDKCGVEVKERLKIKVPLENKGNGIFTAIDIGVCPKCKKEHDQLIELLTEIRFELYKKFYGRCKK